MVFDAGSRALKCAIANEENRIIVTESIFPKLIKSADGFGRKWESTGYWENLLNLAELTIKKAKINSQEIRYITSTAIRPSCLFCDIDFNPLYIGASFDLQGIDYGDEIEEKFVELTGESLYQKTGHFPNFYMVPARYEWLRNNPESINNKKIAHYLPIDSWILVRFGGEFHTNYTSAMESGFYDLKEKNWLKEWYSILEIDDAFLPPTVMSGEIIGNVDNSIQERLGLSPDTELVAGLPDTQAALFAANSISPGNISIVLGTTTPVQAVVENLFIDPGEHCWIGGISIKNICDNYIVEASTGITGQLIKWAANLFDSELEKQITEPSKEQYENIRKRYHNFDDTEITASEEEVKTSAVYANLGPLPLATTSTERLGGEFYFPSPGGVDESYISQNQLIGAIFDNIMFAVSKNVEYLEQLLGFEQFSLTVLGGISRFTLLSQRISDLFNKATNYLQNPEASIQGNLILCDIASGKIKNMQDFEKEISHNGDLCKVEPRDSMTNKLQMKYKEWLRIIDFNT